jgi:general secretion pathway protein K
VRAAGAEYGDRKLCSEDGFALVVVMWIITLLMVIVLSFSAMAKTEIYGTFGFKEAIEKKYLAEAGIQRAVIEFLYRRVQKNQNLASSTPTLRTDGIPYTYQLGPAGYTFRITDESGKININNLTDNTGIVLNNLLRNFGSTEEEANTIVDSILDWKDVDDLHRLHGAEDDYYMSLPNPYKARNAKFETLEELILVRGMQHDVLYGNDKRKGIIHYITIFSGVTTININAAPKEVLMAIPYMTSAIADAIFDRHGSDVMTSAQDLNAMIGDGYKQMLSYANLGSDSNTFTVESVGHKKGEKTGFGIKAVISVDGSNKFKYLYYKCPAGTRQ